MARPSSAPKIASPGPRASIFPTLEPGPLVLPERRATGSLLERLTGADLTRPWLIAGGALCLMMGLLPRGDLRQGAK